MLYDVILCCVIVWCLLLYVDVLCCMMLYLVLFFSSLFDVYSLLIVFKFHEMGPGVLSMWLKCARQIE